MTDSQEMQLRILATLEEAGQDRANPLLNTVIAPTGTIAEVAIFQNALSNLVIAGLIYVRLTSEPHGDQLLSNEDGLMEIARFSEHYQFDKRERLWLDDRHGGPPYYQTPEPEVVLTPAGRSKSVEVLELRGYAWWQLSGR
jgi:hypothetical protein